MSSAFCCHHYLLSGCHEDQRLCRRNYIRFISNCDVPEGVSISFDPEVDLNDDAILGRSRYERFYSVRSNYARAGKSKSSKTFERTQSSGVV